MAIDYGIVLDANERKRMLAEGYLPEVIEGLARERYQQLVDEFRWKNGLLGRYYEPVPYFDFVGDVFPDLEQLMVVTAEQGYKEMTVDELVEYQAQRDDVYVVPASFINGYNSGAACRDVYALVVDVDRVHPETLETIIEKGTLGNRIPMPSYIVNSGRGIHLYYVFREPVPHYFANRKILKDMYQVLCGITQKNIYAKTDWHAITQPFRLPGSLTRLGQTVTGWKSGEKWSVKLLARRLGVESDALDLQRRPLQPQREYHAEKARRQALQESQGTAPARKRTPMQEWTSSLEGKTGFYMTCLERCFEEVSEGNRYWSMCALTVIARKVGYPKEQLEQDLEQLLQHYNDTGKQMKSSEVRKALKMYHPKALQTRSTTLERWFGWEFRRAAQLRKERQQSKGRTVKRTKEEVLERARKIQELDYPDGTWRNTTGAPTKQQTVAAWQAEHPEGKPKECMAETGLSKNTVYKWWRKET